MLVQTLASFTPPCDNPPCAGAPRGARAASSSISGLRASSCAVWRDVRRSRSPRSRLLCERSRTVLVGWGLEQEISFTQSHDEMYNLRFAMHRHGRVILDESTNRGTRREPHAAPRRCAAPAFSLLGGRPLPARRCSKMGGAASPPPPLVRTRQRRPSRSYRAIRPRSPASARRTAARSTDRPSKS